MKPLLLFPAVLLLAAAASYAVARITTCCPAPAPVASPATAEEIARVDRALADLRGREESLAKSIEDLRVDIAAAPRGEARVPVGEIEAAVVRALENRSASAGEETAEAHAPAVRLTSGRDEYRSAYERLLAPGLAYEDAAKIWKEIAESGHLDDVLALFEARAKENPQVAQAQLDLGRAYLQKVFKAGNGPEAGVWATKADKSFDAALSIDDHNWDARFSKAVSLSFWPAVFGKQTEAIKHFEILAEQQAGGSLEPKFAQTWLLLGNLYQQLGKSDQALAAWQKGLALFPDNAQFQQQIANAQGH